MSATKRVRVVQYVVQPVLVVDDGSDLEPLAVEPLTIPAAEWASFVDTGLATALHQLEQGLNDDLLHRADHAPDPTA